MSKKKRRKGKKGKQEGPVVKALSRLLNTLTVGVTVVVFALYQGTTSNSATASVAAIETKSEPALLIESTTTELGRTHAIMPATKCGGVSSSRYGVASLEYQAKEKNDDRCTMVDLIRIAFELGMIAHAEYLLCSDPLVYNRFGGPETGPETCLGYEREDAQQILATVRRSVGISSNNEMTARAPRRGDACHRNKIVFREHILKGAGQRLLRYTVGFCYLRT